MTDSSAKIKELEQDILLKTEENKNLNIVTKDLND